MTDAEAGLMEAIHRADEDGRRGIEMSRTVVDAIEAEVVQFRNGKIQEAIIASKTLTWLADDPSPPKHKSQEGGARKYHGEVVEGYDAKRQDSPKWIEENRIIAEWLSDLPPGTTVLDCPVGTGRFLRLYEESGFNVICMDVSEDMLRKAHEIGSVVKNDYVMGDACDTQLSDKIIDVAMMIRLTRWLSPEDCVRALQEMQRVAKNRIIFTARVRDHSEARGYDLIESALDGWKITKDEGLPDDDAYRVIQLEPV